ncbi:MAG: chorismate mutase [Oscillospiraceae bacterium]|nr:chorismate mutase [Oscillospiraceae bacterium]
MKNIVLIGMIGCGKEKLGALAAEKEGLKFRNIEEIIKLSAQMTATQIFALMGQTGYSQIESAVCTQLSEHTDMIISAGDGIVLNENAVTSLKKSGVLVYIDKTPEVLVRDADTEDRPVLRSGKEKIYELYGERKELYKKYADFIVSTDDDDEALAQIAAIISSVKNSGESDTAPEAADDRLSALRRDIDEIDSELVKLFARRMRICGEIGRIKRERGLPIDDEKREIEVVDRALRKVPPVDYEETMMFMRSLITISKARQQRADD